MLIPITSNYYENGRIYSKNEIDLRPGLSVLVGCNGSGKTTLIHQIKNWCERNNVSCYKFDNYKQGGHAMNDMLGYFGHMDTLFQNISSSEGEQISNNMGIIAGNIGHFLHHKSMAEGHKQGVILLDALDSGLSIDHVIDLKKDLFDTILEDCAKNNFEIYIVMAANEYEMARGEWCIDMTNLQYKKLPTYESYRRLIIKSRKRKNRRYKWGEWDGAS